jgi:hypothetical protein
MAMTAALMTATISGAIPSSEAGSGASGFGGLMGLDVLATLAAALGVAEGLSSWSQGSARITSNMHMMSVRAKKTTPMPTTIISSPSMRSSDLVARR